MREHLPQAQIVFDRFHLMPMAGQALDEVRRDLRRTGAELTGARWRDPRQRVDPLGGGTRAAPHPVCRISEKLGRAVMLRELLQDVLSQEDPAPLRWWCQPTKRALLAPFRKLAETIQQHRAGWWPA